MTTPTAAGGSMASRHRRHSLPSSRARPRALPGSRHPQPRDQSLHSSNKRGHSKYAVRSTQYHSYGYYAVRSLRLFLYGFTCPATTAGTVILWALDRVRGRALGWLGPGSPKSQPHQAVNPPSFPVGIHFTVSRKLEILAQQLACLQKRVVICR